MGELQPYLELVSLLQQAGDAATGLVRRADGWGCRWGCKGGVAGLLLELLAERHYLGAPTMASLWRSWERPRQEGKLLRRRQVSAELCVVGTGYLRRRAVGTPQRGEHCGVLCVSNVTERENAGC